MRNATKTSAKILSLLIVFALLLGLTACAGKPTESPAEEPTPSETVADTPTPSEDETRTQRQEM
jgi:hypothetical protein